MIYSTKPLDERKYLQVAKNYYAVLENWSSKTKSEQHIELCECVSSRREGLIFTGQSACAIYGIPRLNEIEMRPHCISEKPKCAELICWRKGKLDQEAKNVNGLIVSSPARAVIDLAKYDSPSSLLVSINHCLYKDLFDKAQLLEELDNHQGKKWQNIIRKLCLIATAKCESPLETLAWIAINKAGFVMPMQQIKIYDNHIVVARVDMYWEVPSRKIILELDGAIKYETRKELLDEKIREDKLREMGYEIIRATWKEVENGRLINKLSKIKIPKRRYTKTTVFK